MPPQRGTPGRRGRGGRAASTAAAAGGHASSSSTNHGTGRGGGQTGAGTGTHQGPGGGRRGPYMYRGELRRDVEGLMYAFGDVMRPNPDSVALMEDMTVAFLVDVCRRARPLPHLMTIPSNQARVNTVAMLTTQQQQVEQEQRVLDEAVLRAASGTSSGVNRALAMQRTNEASHAKETTSLNGTISDMPIRTHVHPFVSRPRMTVEDVKFACRKDAKMTSRIEELIYLDEVISQVRRGFDVPDEGAIADTAAADNVTSESHPGAATTGQ